MASVHFEGRDYPCAPGQSVLDALVAGGARLTYACRVGQCQSCLLRAVSGDVGEAADGLKATLKVQGYFLPCVCRPTGDLTVERPAGTGTRTRAEVVSLERPAADVARIRLRPAQAFEYRSGQHISVFRDAEVSRSYSLASHPGDGYLELHVRHVAGGELSPWLHGLGPGHVCEIGPPAGDAIYVAGDSQQPLLLVGTGTGLAPLFGIARTALGDGHQGPIYLYHGSRTVDGLYLHDELNELARRHTQFTYIPCLSGDEGLAGARNSRADVAALDDWPDLSGWRIYLCGHPEMVRNLRKRAFLAGAAMADIHADPFTPMAPEHLLAHG